MLTFRNASVILVAERTGGEQMKIREKVTASSASQVIGQAKVATVSARLKKIMAVRNVKQADLARSTGISRGAISNYVLGRYEPKADIIGKLANALNCSATWLWGYDVPMDEAAYLASFEENPYELSMRDAFDTLDLDGQIEASKMVVNYAKNGKSPDQLILTEGEMALIKLLRRAPADEKSVVIEKILSALDDLG